jgi:lysophospholipase L1-like esterase
MDPTYLYALKPGATKVFTHLKINGGRSILVRTNSCGFRGEELLPAGAARRVVVYGDSLIEAEFSALEDTFAKRLERDLAGRLRKPVEVINAGVVGYGPDQVSLRMRAEIADLRPDLVIVSLFADNDFGDLIRNKIYRLSADHELEEGDPLVSQDLKDGFERAETGSMLFRLISKAFSHADAWWVDPLDGIDPGSREFARMEIWLDGCREDYEDYVRRGTVVTNLLEDFYDADVSLTPRSRSARLKAELMDRIVLRLKMTAEAARVPLLILIVPSAHDAVPNYDYGRVDRVKFPEYRPEGMTDLLQGMARRHAIPFVNFFGPFMERGAGDLYFRGGEDHWNDRGQEVAASLVADEIVSSGWLR